LVEPTKLLSDPNIAIIERDLLNLYSVKDEDRLWLFPCKVNGIQGASYPDTGGTKSYSSRKYVEEAELDVHRFDIPMEVSLAGDQKMVVHEWCDVPLEMPAGWNEVLRTYVLDLDAEFDIVLGMDWHKKWKPAIDWDSLTYTLHRSGKVYVLVPYPVQLSTLNVNFAALNTITVRQAQKALKCTGTQAVLYLIRNPEVDDEDNVSFQSMLDSCGDDHDLRKLLTQHRDVFRDKLPDKLSPDRGLVHEINTGNNSPVNAQAYQLSTSQLTEQTKQITDLLSKGLIRESSSS
jgi:Retroviral aspartyl protease